MATEPQQALQQADIDGHWQRGPIFGMGVGTLVCLLLIAGMVFAAVFAPWLAPMDPNLQSLSGSLQPPSWDNLFGTDPLGRDMLSRVIYGTRVSLFVGLASVGLATVLGVALGTLSAFLPPLWGEVIMRVTDTVLTLPSVLVALAVASTIGPSMLNVILIIGLLYWAPIARMVRGEALTIRSLDYVQASRAVGSSTWRILFVGVLPNVTNTIIVMATLQLASAILLESTLSFLGVGVPPPTPTWGNMISEGRPYIAISWWVVTLPGLAIMCAVLAVNMVGDWLRDLLDPRLRQR